MRNNWLPTKTAEYIPITELQVLKRGAELGGVASRDFEFKTGQENEQRAEGADQEVEDVLQSIAFEQVAVQPVTIKTVRSIGVATLYGIF
jgi:hypothetical protein